MEIRDKNKISQPKFRTYYLINDQFLIKAEKFGYFIVDIHLFIISNKPIFI